MNIFNKTCMLGCVLLLFSSTVAARDSELTFPIQDAMDTPTAIAMENVKFYFGDQSHPAVANKIGEYTTRRTTNAFGKSDRRACEWAFLSAIKTLYTRAGIEGGDAVINIQSVTTGHADDSEEHYVCRAGAVIAKVYLRGTVVKLR